MADMGTACHTCAWPVLKRRVGDMRELQQISYRLLVAFCYRHLPPPTSGSEGLLSVVDLPRRPRTTSPPGVRMEGRGVARGAIPPVPRS
jgi:hypothetical protein